MIKTINLQPILSQTIIGLFLLALCAPLSLGNDSGKAKIVDPPNVVAKREAERHLDKAKQFETEAASYRNEIDLRWKQYAKEKRTIAIIPKMVGENPQLKKLRMQAERDVAKLSQLAREADEASQYHRFRALEWADEQNRLAAKQ